MKESEVSRKVRKTLESLENTGDILWFSRLNSGKVRTEYGSWIKLCNKGTPDYIAIVVNKNRNISLLWIECKSSEGKLRPDQIEFKDKHTKHRDIHYFLISEPSTLCEKILAISYDRLNDIKFM